MLGVEPPVPLGCALASAQPIRPPSPYASPGTKDMGLTWASALGAGIKLLAKVLVVPSQHPVASYLEVDLA